MNEQWLKFYSELRAHLKDKYVPYDTPDRMDCINVLIALWTIDKRPYDSYDVSSSISRLSVLPFMSPLGIEGCDKCMTELLRRKLIVPEWNQDFDSYNLAKEVRLSCDEIRFIVIDK